MSAPRPGRHELGQNFLVDQGVIRAVVDLATETDDLLVEWAAGDGVLTLPLAAKGRLLEAVEIDPRRAAKLRRRVPPHVCITEGDILRHAPPDVPYSLVCNIPFHITTAVVRRLLSLPRWRRAVLVTQWEVARKRAGVGGATQLTAQWWPWFEFSLKQRIPAAAFRPRPSVDAGLLLVRRRDTSFVDARADYQRWVRDVFAGPGRGMPSILARVDGIPLAEARRRCRSVGLTDGALPRDLSAEQWTKLYRLSRQSTRRGG